MIRIMGTKIRKLREEIGLTQEDLAKSVGLSSEFISLLELGKRSPSLESLSKIARFLDKEVSFFILEKKETFDTLIRGQGLDAKSRRLMKKFKKYCDEYLELEEMTGRQSDLAPLYTNITAEKMAEQERRRLDIGNDPIHDVFFLLEQNGLHVWRYPVPEEINLSGAFVFVDYKQAAFALVNSSLLVAQQMLAAAHEYGHYLKDRHDGAVIDNPDIFIEDYITLYHAREKYAQTFALHFLMPPRKIKEIVEKDIRSKSLNFSDALYIQRYLGVSLIPLLQMLKRLEYISAAQFKDFQKREALQNEKGIFSSSDSSVRVRKKRQTFVSERFKSLVLDACRMRKISVEEAAMRLHIDKNQISSLLKQ
jgi:transcriptional regulator with XRE-family HTH domain